MIDHATWGVTPRAGLAIVFGLIACLFGMSAAVAMNPRQPFHSYVLDHWSVEQGLPQITVLAMAEDRAGFLWINTQAAVARFDGARFVTYDRAATGVDTSMLKAAWADPTGGVWFGGAHGLVHERGGHFTLLGGAAVNAIVDAGDGTPLLATSQGLKRVRNGKIVAAAGSAESAFSLLRDGQTVWVGGVGRVCRIDQSVRPMAPICIRADSPQRGVIVSQLALQGGRVWLGTQTGLMRVSGDKLVAAGFGDGLDGSSIESLLTDHDGILWIGTVGALYRLLPDDRLERVGDATIAQRPWLQSIFEDRRGNLWLGTHTRGIYRVWNGWTRHVSVRDGVQDPLVWSVIKAPDGRIVFGTNSDVEVFDGEHVSVLIPGSALPDPSAYDLYYDRQNRLWVGTRAGVAVFENGRDVTPSSLSALRRWRIDVVSEVGTDDFWIGTSGGLYRWRHGNLSRADPGASTAAAIIRSILPLTPDHLYLGTEDGLREWRAGKVTQPAWAKPLDGYFITHVAMLKPGLLGVATADAGIGLVADNRLRMTGKTEGLPSNNLWTFDVLGEDLYVSSSVGAWRLPLAKFSVPGSAEGAVSPQLLAGEERISSVNGLHCCNGGASARSVIDGDVIWYSTTDGLLGVDTRALGALPKAPAAQVVGVEYEGQRYTGRSFALDNGMRDLTIVYTAPYLGIGPAQFRYRLEGYDSDWQVAGTRREAFYTHLPAGDYRFRVAATLEGADGYGPEADFVIHIKPYWYERLGVRALGLVALGLLAFALVQWSMRRQRRRNAWLEEQVQRRTGELTRALERLRVTNLALAEESHTDALTALYNRRYLLAQLPAVLSPDAAVGVVQIDIDHFKQINDNYGHAVGDSVLRELGAELTALRRGNDIIVRWGGEEFLLLLQQVDAAEGFSIVERLRRQIAAKTFDDGRGGIIRLTCSIGFSMHPLAGRADQSTFDAALELADLALYRAKSMGRDQCVGLVITAALTDDILQHPFAGQLDGLLASRQLRWIHRSE